ISLPFLIDQIRNVNCLTVFELVVLFILQFLSPKGFRGFLRPALLIVLLAVLGLPVIVASVKQKFHIPFIRIELYVCIKGSTFCRNHSLNEQWFALHLGLFLFVI